MDTVELLDEMKRFLEALDIPREKRTIFRSDHASNYLVLKGILGRDKQKMVSQLQSALDGESELRQEWQRGL